MEKGDVAHLRLVLMVLSVHNLAMSSVALTMTVLATAVLVAVTLAACKNWINFVNCCETVVTLPVSSLKYGWNMQFLVVFAHLCQNNHLRGKCQCMLCGWKNYFFSRYGFCVLQTFPHNSRRSSSIENEVHSWGLYFGIIVKVVSTDRTGKPRRLFAKMTKMPLVGPCRKSWFCCSSVLHSQRTFALSLNTMAMNCRSLLPFKGSF